MLPNIIFMLGCKQATIPSLSDVEIWNPYMDLTDTNIKESIYQYSEGLLNILCSFTITKDFLH